MLHGQRPSFSQLAAAARSHTTAGTLTTQAVIDIVTGKTQEPADEIVRALASALALPVEEVARWIGRPLDVGAPYVPPNGADRLSRKQREALDHIIRVMIDREDVGNDDRSAATKQAGGSPAESASVDNVARLPSAEALDPTIPDDVAARSEKGKGKSQEARERQDIEGEAP